MLTPDVGCLSLVLYGGYGGVAVTALLVPAATSSFPMIQSPLPMWIAGLALGLGVTLAVVASSYWVSVREVTAIGE